MHHTIEERHIFPLLAKYMPKFGIGADEVHIKSHRAIHDGLENLEKLVAKWKAEPSKYSPTEMRACLDGFRDVLFDHLDEEVEDLRGQNLKKYMTLEQLATIPI
jgi:hemerythrin-like domain-containing protein